LIFSSISFIFYAPFHRLILIKIKTLVPQKGTKVIRGTTLIVCIAANHSKYNGIGRQSLLCSALNLRSELQLLPCWCAFSRRQHLSLSLSQFTLSVNDYCYINFTIKSLLIISQGPKHYNNLIFEAALLGYSIA
jgi:hypothetical protein